MFPKLSVAPRTPRTPRINDSKGGNVSFLPGIVTPRDETAATSRTSVFAATLDLDTLNLGELDDEQLFQLAAEAKAETELERARQESSEAVAKGDVVEVSAMIQEPNPEKFLHLLGLVTTMADMIALRDGLLDKREAVDNKIAVMEEYYETISHGKKVGGAGKERKLAGLHAQIELIAFKEEAVASQLSKMESKHASSRASLGRTLNSSFSSEADPLLSQQQERASKAAEWFGPVLNYPLNFGQVTPRIKNELVIPWLLRVASLDSSTVERSDALAQWMFHEFLDSFTIAELMRLTPDEALVATAKRVLLALHPTLVTPIPPVLTTASDSIAERVVPDLTRVILLAIAAGNMTDVALILSSESCNVEQALLDSEMRAIILYAIVWSGQVDTLRFLSKRGLAHSHLILAILFICPNIAALQVERSVSVKTASYLAQHQLEIALSMIHRAKQTRSTLSIESPVPSRTVSIVMAHDDWDEDPVDVDLLLDEWDTTKACVSPAGGYTNVPFETIPPALSSQKSRATKNWSSRQRVPFTQLVDSGRFKAIQPTMQALGVPYFGTDCVQKFGNKAFSSQTSAFHVAVRGDVPVILRSSLSLCDEISDRFIERTKNSVSPPRRQSPLSSQPHEGGERHFYYYEAHISLDAITSGEDAVHVGWCSNKFPADGVTPALLGNDDHSLGISLIAFDTVETALHCSSVANSRASVVRGDVSALSMRARSRAEGFTSRFSVSGGAVAVAVKHCNGHSQRQFTNASHTVQIAIRDTASMANSVASSESRFSPHQSDLTNWDASEFCGETVVCNYYEAFGESFPGDVENHGCAVAKEDYKVEPAALEWSAVQPSGDYAPPSPTSEKDRKRCSADTIPGDVVVVGCLLDMATHQTTFFVNGTSLGVSFDALPTGADLLYPCISMVKFQESATRATPVCRFAFDHNDLRYFPTLPTNQADSAGSRQPQDCASPAQRQLRLFNSEAKLSFMVWMMHLEESQAATDLQPLSEIHVDSTGVSDLMCEVFPVGTSLLNQRCEDRRMHFKPIAIINETVDLGAQHQDLDSSSLCCVSSPTPLLFALLQRRRDVALTIASSPLVDVAITDNFGTTPLFVAAALGYVEIVRVILYRGSAKALLKTFSGYTPLHTAIMGEHETTAEVILTYAKEMMFGDDQSALLDAPTPKGNTAIHLATKMKLVDTVRRLLAAGANATLLDKRQNATALLLACSGEMPEIAEVLLKSRQYHGHPSINVPAKDNGGVALCFAAQKGMTALMPLFAEAGADPDLLLVEATPLICAIVMNFEVTAIALVDSFLSPDVKRSFYELLQSKLRDSSEKRSIISPVSKRTGSPFFCNFDVHAVDPKSQSTALHLACELNMISLVQRLLDFGALICSVNKQFATPLHLAVQNGHEELAISLLQRGKEMVQEGQSSFDISLMDARGDTVLHVACRTGMMNVIDKILSMFTVQEMLFLATRTKNPRIKPFDLLAENRMGDTPLLAAIKWEHEDAADLLISSADPATNIAAVLDNTGCSKALMAAVDKGYFKLARVLLQRGAVATNDIRAFIHQKWEAAMTAQELQARSVKLASSQTSKEKKTRPSIAVASNSTTLSKAANRRASLLIVDEQHLDYPFGSESASKMSRKISTKGTDGGGGMQRVKSVSQLVAARLSETQRSASRSSMRRRSTVQKLFRPVGARFDDTVATALLRLFHVDELIYEFECIMGYGTLSAPEVVEHGELIVTCLLAHSKICFSASEAHVIAKTGYLYLQSRATTQSMLQRKEIAKKQSSLCEKIFRVIRYYTGSQGNFAVEALQKIVEVHRAFSPSRESEPSSSRISVDEADLTNPFSGVTALQLASSLGQDAVVKFLCKNISLNPAYAGQKSHKQTIWNANISLLLPIRIAILHNHPETLEVLLSEGRCDPNAMEPLSVWPSRDSQLHTAARVSSSRMVEMLLTFGATTSGVPNTEGDDIWQFVVRESADVLATLLRLNLTPDPDFLLMPTNTTQRRSLSATGDASDSEDNSRTGEIDNLVFSFVGSEAPEVGRNVEYFRRWFSAPFLDPDIFDHSPFGGSHLYTRDDLQNEGSGADANEGSSLRTPADQELTAVAPATPPRSGLRSYSDAYFSSLLFACVRHNPQLVLQLMKSIPLNINVTHPATDDSMLMFVISEAVITGTDRKRESMIELATAILHNFRTDLSLSSLRADGESALSLAARCGDLDLIQLLLEYGAPVLVPKKQQQAYFASSANMSSVPRQKVIIWKLLAQLHYPFKHDDVVMYIAKFLETSPATRRAFIAAVMPNLHPLGLLRLICTSPSDIVSACTNAALGLQQDATLSFWLCIFYVTCFLPDNLKSDHYLPKKLLDTALQPLTPNMPPVIHLTLHLLKLRQKSVREQQAMLQQLLNMLQPQMAMPAISTGPGLVSAQSGRAADRQSFARRNSSRLSAIDASHRQHAGRSSVSANSYGPRMSVVGSDTGLLHAPSESPAASSGLLQVPPTRSRRVSLVDSENTPGELQREHSSEDLALIASPFDVEVPQLESPVGNFGHDSPAFGVTPTTRPLGSDAQEPSPLKLVNTPANLKLNITLNMIPLGIEPPRPQKGISVEILHFKAMDSWLCAVRENQTSTGGFAASPEPSSPITPSPLAAGSAASTAPIPPSNSNSEAQPVATPLDRMIDVLEICLRFGKNDTWAHYTDMIPATVKLAGIAKERSFLAVATLCSNVPILSSLMHVRADVMLVDEIIGESGIPVGMQKSMFMAGSSTAVAVNSRDALMAAFKRQRRRLDDDAGHSASPRKSAVVSSHFRFSVSGDTSIRRQGLVNLNRRMTYDPASSMKANQPKIGLYAADGGGHLPGSINAVKSQKGASVTLKVDDAPAPTPNFVYCLFDWAVFRHAYFGNRIPSTATNDTIMYLMNRRCPPTYHLLQLMLSREFRPRSRSPTGTFAGLSEGGWKTSGKHEVGINMLSAAHQDSWLHLLVMHNQVVMADYFLIASKGMFGHSTRRNAAGLVPADYCSSYHMLMVLQHHECVDLGFAASSVQRAPSPVSSSTAKISAQPQVQLLVVSKGFMKLLDNDNTGIDRRMQVPTPPPRNLLFGSIDEDNSLREALERQEALAILSPRNNEQRIASMWSTGSASPSVQPSQAFSGASVPRPPARISDETLLRNQRNTQRYLQDVFLPLVLYEASPTQDNFRIRKRPAEVSSPAMALDSSVVSSTDFLNQTVTSEAPFGASTRKLVPLDSKPLSLQLLEQPHHDHVPQPPQQPVGIKLSATSSLPSPRRSGMPAAKAKSYVELVDTLQRNMYFTFVDDVSNKSHVRLSQDLNDPTKNGSRALFIAAPMLQQALKSNLIRLQNHRVAPYDQLDSAVLCSSQALQRPAQLKALREQLVELAASSLTALTLEIAPDYC
jgi:ankyrin repeat protein